MEGDRPRTGVPAASRWVVSQELHFFYCGNGDTILARAGNDWGLIDCNLTKSSAARHRLLDVLDRNQVQRLRFACVTHYDADHLRGMAGLLRERFSADYGDNTGRRRWLIDQIIQPMAAKDILRALALMKQVVARIDESKVELDFSAEALELFDLIKQMLLDGKGLPREERVYMPPYPAPSFLASAPPSSGGALFGPFEVCFLAPEQTTSDEFEADRFFPVYKELMNDPDALRHRIADNRVSRVIVFRHVDTREAALFCADAPRECWPQIMQRWNEIRAFGLRSGEVPHWSKFDVIKVSHHGAEDSHYPPLFSDWVAREKTIAVVSCLSEDAKHPHPTVWKALRESGVRIEATGTLRHSKAPAHKGPLPGGRPVRPAPEAADICVCFGDAGLTVTRSAAIAKPPSALPLPA